MAVAHVAGRDVDKLADARLIGRQFDRCIPAGCAEPVGVAVLDSTSTRNRMPRRLAKYASRSSVSTAASSRDRSCCTWAGTWSGIVAAGVPRRGLNGKM